jgi:hypothetical protein
MYDRKMTYIFMVSSGANALCVGIESTLDIAEFSLRFRLSLNLCCQSSDFR